MCSISAKMLNILQTIHSIIFIFGLVLKGSKRVKYMIKNFLGKKLMHPQGLFFVILVHFCTFLYIFVHFCTFLYICLYHTTIRELL